MRLLAAFVALICTAFVSVSFAADETKTIEIPAQPGGTSIYYLLPSVILKDHEITITLAEPWPDVDSCKKAGAEMTEDWKKDSDIDLDQSSWICVERVIPPLKAPAPAAPKARPAKKNET